MPPATSRILRIWLVLYMARFASSFERNTLRSSSPLLFALLLEQATEGAEDCRRSSFLPLPPGVEARVREGVGTELTAREGAWEERLEGGM
mmetsp:Transcript_6680/g.18280  ORF Transcript_6680/g.18280 Transcript_6680/m.18280 type:complete len:91 (+) Transcript_6680:267-539(+)